MRFGSFNEWWDLYSSGALQLPEDKYESHRIAFDAAREKNPSPFALPVSVIEDDKRGWAVVDAKRNAISVYLNEAQARALADALNT